MNKLRTGDEVIVISGKDRGKTGTITKFLENFLQTEKLLELIVVI